MSDPKPEPDLPPWYYLIRAIICFSVGTALILHETFVDTNPPGLIVIIIGLTLMGFAPSDFATFFKAGK